MRTAVVTVAAILALAVWALAMKGAAAFWDESHPPASGDGGRPTLR